MIELKTPKEIEAMKPAGRFVGGILRDLKEFTKVGTNLLEIDEFVHKRIVDRKGASSCYVDYAPDFGTGPFAHYICTSVNDAVLHGVPYDYNLKDGDLVSLDLAINVDGWVADSAISFCVGHIMHGDPHVPNDGKAHHGYKLRPGLVIAIEPWFLKTTDEIYQDPKDGWTLKSEDGSRGAHSEHTIAITENGPVILTVRD